MPTYLLHGEADDLVPCGQAERVYTALKERGVVSECKVLKGAGHLFDLRDGEQEVREAVNWLGRIAFGNGNGPSALAKMN